MTALYDSPDVLYDDPRFTYGGAPILPGAHWRVLVDWDLDGSYAEEFDDIGQHVRSLRWQRGGGLFGTGAHYGSATIELRNPEHRYLDTNTLSPLAGKLRPGRPVWIAADHEAVRYPLFAGYLKRIVPHPSDIPSERRATLEVEDALARWVRWAVSLTGWVGWTLHDIRLAVLASVGVPAARHELVPAGDVVLEELVEGGATAVLEQLNAAVLASHWIRPTIDPDRPWQYVSVDRNHSLTAAADVSVTYGGGDGYGALDGWIVEDDTLINRQEVRYRADPTIEDHEPLVAIEHPASRDDYGPYAGGSISSDLISSAALATGVGAHMTWRHRDPRQGPTLTFQNAFATMLARDLRDVVAVTDPRYELVNRRMEIVGIGGRWAHTLCEVDWQLQDAPEQPPLTNFARVGTTHQVGTGSQTAY